MSEHKHDDHDVYHVTAFPTYVKVYAVLIAMTILTVFSATQLHFGSWNTPIAMFIATFKAFCVVWWFMHQKYEVKLNRAIFMAGFIFLAIFIFFTATDIWTRVNFSEIQYQQGGAAVEGSATH